MSTPSLQFSGLPWWHGWHAAVMDFLVYGFNDLIHIREDH